MKKLITLVLLIITAVAVVFTATRGAREQSAQADLYLKTSDAAKITRTITIAGDDWLGYAVCRSPRFAQILAQDGIGVKFEMVFDFNKRVAGLADGQYQFIVITLDSYLAQGERYNWPGVNLWTIDESNGGDAILGVPPIKTIDDLNTGTGAYTAGSPSEFLLRSQITHFQLNTLRGKMPQFATQSVEEAYNRFKSGQADFAVLWEPFKTKALQEIPNAKVIIDTSKARGLIIDVFVAARSMLAKEPDTTQKVAKAYFTTLHEWLNSPAKFTEAGLRDISVRDHSKTLVDAEEMLKGIHFASLDENAREGGWMSAGDPRLAISVSELSKILDNQGPPVNLPNGDPNALIYHETVQNVQGVPKLTTEQPVLSEFYPPLSPEDWKVLAGKVKGTLLDTPILFRPGQSDIPDETQDELRDAAPKLVHYPTYRIVVEAHSFGNTPDIDQQLSQERAEEVRRFLVQECNIPEERILAVGKGSSEALERFPDEDDQAYARRNRRARILLVGD